MSHANIRAKRAHRCVGHVHQTRTRPTDQQTESLFAERSTQKKRSRERFTKPTLNELGGSNFTFYFMAKNADYDGRGQKPMRPARSSSHGIPEESQRTISTIHHPTTHREQRPPTPKLIFELEGEEQPFDTPRYNQAQYTPDMAQARKVEKVTPQDKPRPRNESVDNTGSNYLPTVLNSKRNIQVPDRAPPKHPGKVTVTTKEEDGVVGRLSLSS